MNDLISRQAAIDALRTCQTYLFHTYDPDKKISLESAEFEIEQLPSAQPEIIRCKDCKHNYNCEIQYAAQAGDLFYCDAAERRTDA